MCPPQEQSTGNQRHCTQHPCKNNRGPGCALSTIYFKRITDYTCAWLSGKLHHVFLYSDWVGVHIVALWTLSHGTLGLSFAKLTY